MERPVSHSSEARCGRADFVGQGVRTVAWRPTANPGCWRRPWRLRLLSVLSKITQRHEALSQSPSTLVSRGMWAARLRPFLSGLAGAVIEPPLDMYHEWGMANIDNI
jgi:hypothetical protein